jgi:TBC1 domain family protein 5
LREEYVISTLRTLSWKVFLGVVTPDADRVQQMGEHRKGYEELLIKYKIDPHSNKELDPEINNPLSTSEQSPWLQFFQNAELEREIYQDIERTYPEFEFFQLESVRQMMLRILFIYARQHPDITYKQGMHEILAPLLFIFHREQITPTNK